MGSGDHFGAEAEANMLRAEERMAEDFERRQKEQRHEEAYRRGVLTPRSRKLFVFKGESPAVFDPDHYPLATDKDVQHDPLVRRLLEEIENLRAQLPIRRQCLLCGVQRSVECFTVEEKICDRCNLTNALDESREEHASRVHWQDEATKMRQELGAAKSAAKASDELSMRRKYENDKLQNELMNKTLAMKLTTEALQAACSFIRSQPHKLTCPKSANPKSELDCTCGINRALGLQPEKKLT